MDISQISTQGVSYRRRTAKRHYIVEVIYRQQDRRWNADKPSAALDPYIPIWLTTSPANQRPANFWKSFFFKHWKEIVKSLDWIGFV